MEFPYKHVLTVGSTSGIGKAMADQLFEAGSKVIAVGRTRDRLDEFVARHGKSSAAGIPFAVLT